MEIYTDPKAFKNTSQTPILLTIGNFDGVHRGHQFLLKSLVAEAKIKGQKVAVMTFVPHPRLVLGGSRERFLLNTYEERRELLKNIGVNILFEVEFNRDLSGLDPEEFLKIFVFKIENLVSLVLGHDFSFGANKTGGHELTAKLCAQRGIHHQKFEAFDFQGTRVSSSVIRKLIGEGNIQLANDFLARTFFLSGIVVKGQGRGRQIGFPTANLLCDSLRLFPRLGVYLTKIKYKDSWYYGLTNVGKNPTFLTGDEVHIESFLFDFNNDIYGESLEVHFKQRIRDEIRFKSVNELIAQIKSDVLDAKKLLALS